MTRETTTKSQRDLTNLRVEIDRLRGRFSLLAELGARVTASLEPASVLQAVVDAACQLTGAKYGALAVFDDAGRIVEFITHGITQQERQRIGDLPQGLGMLGWLRQVQEPIRLADLSDHPRSVGFPPHHPAMKTFLGSPILYGDDSLGNLDSLVKSLCRSN